MIYANELTLERSLDNSTMRASHTRKTNPVTTVVGLRATGCQSDLLGGNGRLTLNLIHWSMIQSIRPRKQNLNENPVHHRRWGSSLGGDTQQYHQGDISWRHGSFVLETLLDLAFSTLHFGWFCFVSTIIIVNTVPSWVLSHSNELLSPRGWKEPTDL